MAIFNSYVKLPEGIIQWYPMSIAVTEVIQSQLRSEKDLFCNMFPFENQAVTMNIKI